MRPCPLRPWQPPRQSADVEQPAAEAKPQETPELPAETVAYVAPARPAAAAIEAATIYRHRFRDAKPINFGKTSPKQLAVHGVDVSRWQGEIDWQKLRSHGANFVYIKATDGGDHLDPMFKKNWRAAEQAGLKRGAYHFFYWCRTGRRAGRLVHPQRAEGRGRAAAGHRCRVERRVRAASGARRAPRCWRRCRSSWTSSSGITASARSSTPPGLLSRQSQGRFPRLPVLAARGGAASVQGLSRPQMGVLAVFRLRPLARA